MDGALERGVRGRQRGRPDGALSAPGRGRAGAAGAGLSARLIRAMTVVADRHGLDALIAPVRPTLKHRYPTTPMRHYVRWARADGAPFDPWLRVHWRLGAKVLRVAPRSMVVTGTVAEWEAWTRMTFPESGRYIGPRSAGARDDRSPAESGTLRRARTCGCCTPSGRRGKRDDVQHVRLGAHAEPVGKAADDGCEECTRWPEGRPRQ